jgi:hypothetical protein
MKRAVELDTLAIRDRLGDLKQPSEAKYLPCVE